MQATLLWLEIKSWEIDCGVKERVMGKDSNAVV